MKLIAHRSGPVDYPEQTILSARQALELGADMVEIDVRFTADGQVAITHDDNLKRIFGVDKSVGELTRTEFLALRHKTEPSCPAHLFEDYLKCGVRPLLLHIKQKAAIGRLLQLVDQYGFGEDVVFGVADPDSARQIREYNSGWKILSFSARELVDDFIALGVDYIRLWEAWLEPELILRVRASGAQVWVMSGGIDTGFPVGEPDEEHLRAILRHQPDGLLINNVAFARRVIGEM